MSIEAKIEALTAALLANTAALLGKPAAAPGDTPKEETSSRRSRSTETKDDAKKDGLSSDDVKKAFAKFLDLPSDPDGDAEYEKRLTTVVDPIFDKAGVKEFPDLPEKFWPELLDGIAAYGKDAAPAGRARRSR